MHIYIYIKTFVLRFAICHPFCHHSYLLVNYPQTGVTWFRLNRAPRPVSSTPEGQEAHLQAAMNA